MTIKTLNVGLLSTCCYVLWGEDGEGCVVIDPGAEADRIRQAAQGRRIEAILLTHGHFDHMMATEALMDDDTQLVIHRLDAPMLSDPETNVSWMIGQSVTAPQATLTVTEGSRLHYAGLDFEVLHTPGHTRGSVCYLTGEHLFTGDTMFRYGCGRTDLPGGSGADMHASLQRLYPLARKYHIHPGHEG